MIASDYRASRINQFKEGYSELNEEIEKELNYYGDVEFQKFPKISRLSNEMITITEKIDGTNGQICVWRDKRGLVHIRAGSRNKWLDEKNTNFGFYNFVMDNSIELMEGLGEGRHYGEWYGKGINRNYGLEDRRFALFNTQRWNKENKPSCCEVVPVIQQSDALDFIANSYLTANDLRHSGSHVVPGYMKPEGIIIYLHNLGRYYKVLLVDDNTHKGESDA